MPRSTSPSSRGTTWNICPTASHWQNGLAELGVKAFKETIGKATDGRDMHYAKLLTYLQRVASIINDLPLGVRHLDAEMGVPPTCN